MRIIAATVLATLACLAHADDQFTCPKEAGFAVYSELKFDKSTVCISYSNDIAKLSIIDISKICYNGKQIADRNIGYQRRNRPPGTKYK